MGEQGLGRGAGRFHLLRIEAVDLDGAIRECLYERDENRLAPPSRQITGAEAVEWGRRQGSGAAAEQVEVSFLTPTLLKRRGEAQRVPEFGVLWHAVQLRLSLLRLAHGAGRPATDFRGSLEQAERVPLAAWESREVAWERYSRRQDRRVPMRGFVGTARYRDVPVEFLPALKLGTLLGIGDNAVFGQGWYEVAITGDRRVSTPGKSHSKANAV
jgi:hypothetical protein